MRTSQKLVIVTLASLTLLSTAMAAPSKMSSEEKADVSNRSNKTIGAYVGVLGDPHPTLLGINAAYNALDFLRVSLGFGQISVSSASVSSSQGTVSSDSKSMTTIGLATKALVPGWSLTPTVGVGYSHVFLSEGMTIGDDYKANNIYTSLGIDWQTRGGFNLGGGMNLSVNGAAPTAPYINIGYFFL